MKSYTLKEINVTFHEPFDNENIPYSVNNIDSD